MLIIFLMRVYVYSQRIEQIFARLPDVVFTGINGARGKGFGENGQRCPGNREGGDIWGIFLLLGVVEWADRRGVLMYNSNTKSRGGEAHNPWQLCK